MESESSQPDAERARHKGGGDDEEWRERTSAATTSGEERASGHGSAGDASASHWRKLRNSPSFHDELETHAPGGSFGSGARKGGGMKQVISNVMYKAANSHLNILRRSTADLELYDCGPTMPTPEPVSQPAVPSAALDKNPSQDAITVPLKDEGEPILRMSFASSPLCTPSRLRKDIYQLPPPSSDARFALPTLAEAREELCDARLYLLYAFSALDASVDGAGDVRGDD